MDIMKKLFYIVLLIAPCIAVASGITSPPAPTPEPCITGYTRVLENYCRANVTSDVFLTRNACTVIAGLPTGTYGHIRLNMEVPLGDATTNTTSVSSYTTNTCATFIEANIIRSRSEPTFLTLPDVLFSTTMHHLLDTNAIRFTSTQVLAGTNVSYRILGYFDKFTP